MDAGKPTVLLIGPLDDGALGIMAQFMSTLGVDARIHDTAEVAVDLAISGKADVLVYMSAPDLTGPEAFEAIRWGYSTAGFIYLYRASDTLKDRIIEDARARAVVYPLTLRRIKEAVASVSPACERVLLTGKAPA